MRAYIGLRENAKQLVLYRLSKKQFPGYVDTHISSDCLSIRFTKQLTWH